jgi:hypothetical protein
VSGIAPVGPVSGVNGMVFVDDNPEAGPEVYTGNPWPSPGAPGYLSQPLRYPGQLWSQGYGVSPQLPAPDTAVIDDDGGYAVPVAVTAGPGTPYFDATPNTHAGPWVGPYETNIPDQAAARAEVSAAMHADGLDNRPPGLIIAPMQDDWVEYWNGHADGALVGDGGQNSRASAGWGSTDATQNPDGHNQTEDFDLHGHRRVATGRNLPLNFLWMPGSGRPLVNTVHGLQALPVGQGSPYEGQDPSYGYGTAGAVLTLPAGDYEAPAGPWQPGPLTEQGLLEGPL